MLSLIVLIARLNMYVHGKELHLMILRHIIIIIIIMFKVQYPISSVDYEYRLQTRVIYL